VTKAPIAAPYAPYPWEKNVLAVYAVQALHKGEATPEQQRLAVDLIINGLSDYYGLSYRPDTHDTAFAEGRRFVGAQIVKLLKLSPAVIAAVKKKTEKN